MKIQGVLKHVSQAKKLGTGKWQIMADRGYINTVFRFMRLPAAKVEKILKGSLFHPSSVDRFSENFDLKAGT